jgi:hypothetical protein
MIAFLRTIDRADLTVLKLMKLDGIKRTELNSARDVGSELKKRRPKTKNKYIYVSISISTTYKVTNLLGYI